MNFRRSLMGARDPLRIDLTSLVDVVFLLIIFLLVTTTFKKTEHAFEIQLPMAGTDSVVIRTDVALLYIGETGDLAFVDPNLGGSKIASAPPDEIRARIEEYMAAHPEAPIRVRAGRNTEYQKVLNAVGLVHSSGARNVQLEYDKAPPGTQGGPQD